MHVLRSLSVLTLAAAATLSATAQQSKKDPAAVSVTPTAASTPHQWNTEEILTCTVSDCWQLAGKDEATFFDIIQQLAQISATHRNLVLPDTEEAGRRTGEYIKNKAHTDHGQLLYAIVDGAVRHVGTPAPTAAATH